MPHRTASPLTVLFLVSGLILPGDLHAQATPQVTSAQWKQLAWFQGSWLGSGGQFPAFYEQYRALDDSTIQMRAFSDSTFQKATDSSRIEFRGGLVSKHSERSHYRAILVKPDRIQFLPVGATSGGFTFTRVSADQWTATLHPAAPGRSETVYVMRRLRP